MQTSWKDELTCSSKVSLGLEEQGGLQTISAATSRQIRSQHLTFPPLLFVDTLTHSRQDFHFVPPQTITLKLRADSSDNLMSNWNELVNWTPQFAN